MNKKESTYREKILCEIKLTEAEFQDKDKTVRISVLFPVMLIQELDDMKNQYRGLTRSILIRKAVQAFLKLTHG